MNFREGKNWSSFVVVVRWQKNNEKVGKEAREVKRKSKQIVAEGLKRKGRIEGGGREEEGRGIGDGIYY